MTPEEIDAAIDQAAAAAQPLADVAAAVVAWLGREWLSRVGTPRTAADADTARGLLDEVQRRLADLPEVDPAPLRAGYRRAYANEYGSRDPSPLIQVRDAVDDMRAGLAARAKRTADALDGLHDQDTVRWGEVTRAMQPAVASSSEVRSAAVRAVMAGQHDGVMARARLEKLSMIVEPEREACLLCLSFAGAVALPDGEFEPRLDYLTEVDVPWSTPQFHPSCRCRLRLFRVGFAADALVRDALLREADRAVLRGTTAYGSEAARFRAAGRLLEGIASGRTKTRVPKTVRERARRAVKQSKFPDRDDRPVINRSARREDGRDG